MRADYTRCAVLSSATGVVTAPRFVVGDALAEQAEIFAGSCALLSGDDEQTHRGLQQATAGERQVRAAQCVLADFGDPNLAFSQYFTIELLRTQYVAYYLAAIVLSWPFGVLIANKILITASIFMPAATFFMYRGIRPYREEVARLEAIGR